jgi:hypothetical protein
MEMADSVARFGLHFHLFHLRQRHVSLSLRPSYTHPHAPRNRPNPQASL